MIIGQKNGSAIGTPVERTTRYLLLLHLPDELVRTLNWDQGKELSSHVWFVNSIWPLRDGLKWPHPMAREVTNSSL